MEATMNTTYKFRAECAADAQAVRAVLLPWLFEWQEVRANLNYEGVRHAMPDVDVEFTLVDCSPALCELLWLLDGVDNCHVAADTLAIAEDYTGERKFRMAFEAPAKRPREEILLLALAAVRTRQKVLSHELERALQLHRTYDAASRLGDKWQPTHPDEPSPGWLVTVAHEATGLASVRRIGAPFGCKKWQKLENGIVKARMLTING